MSFINTVLLFCFFLLATPLIQAQVGVGTATPDASAQLEMSSVTKGFLPPRMTSVQRDAIGSPATGLVIYCTNDAELQVYTGGTGWRNMQGETVFSCGSPVTFIYRNASVTYGTVSSAGKCWLDRNLGATQIATSSTDFQSYGDLFQWGRGDDGHQKIAWSSWSNGALSSSTTTLSSTDKPGNGNFITTSSQPYDWRSGQNATLWQGVNGVNNPCPSGWRLPTVTELESERLSWSQSNSTGAFASPLKWSMPGTRSPTMGSTLSNTGSNGYIWSSTIFNTQSRVLFFNSASANTATVSSLYRGEGANVRCIKD